MLAVSGIMVTGPESDACVCLPNGCRTASGDRQAPQTVRVPRGGRVSFITGCAEKHKTNNAHKEFLILTALNRSPLLRP